VCPLPDTSSWLAAITITMM
jgi:hypothetical protein